MWRAYSTLFVAAAGAGLLSYPFAVQQQGVALCVALTIFFAAMTVLTDYVLISAGHLFRAQLTKEPGLAAFDALCLCALGPRQARVASASIIIGGVGAQVGVLIAIGDLLCQPLQAATGCPASAAAGPPLCALASRAFVIPAVALSLLPLTFLSSTPALGHSSALAAVTVLAVCGVVAAQGVGALARVPLAVVPSASTAPAADGPTDVVLARWGLGIFLGVPISVFSLGNHMQVLPTFLEASPRVQAAFPRVVAASVGSCVLLYLATGLLGYFAYRRDTLGDVMLNLPAGGLTSAGKVVLALHLLLAYPVLFFPARRSLMKAAGEAAQWLRGGGSEGAAAESIASSSSSNNSSNSHRLAALCQLLSSSPFAMPLLVTASCALLAVAAPSITVVFGLLGATVATYQIYFVPGLLLLRFAAALEGKGGSASADAHAAAREATWASVPRLWASGEGEAQQQPLLGGGEEEEGGERTREAAAAALPPPRLLPLHSAVLTRALAWLLLALSALIGILGTVVYVLSTWG
jgi:amino acid permease